MKTLIAYYSLTGETAKIARLIARRLPEADIVALKPENDLAAGSRTRYLRGGYLAVFKKSARLTQSLPDLSGYPRIIIGTPVWASTFTPAVRGFCQKADLSGKKALLFCTHKGGPGKCLDKLKQACREKGGQVLGQQNFKETGARDQRKDDSSEIEAKIDDLLACFHEKA